MNEEMTTRVTIKHMSTLKVITDGRPELDLDLDLELELNLELERDLELKLDFIYRVINTRMS